MTKEELEEIENTLKIAKPYNELGSYHYFNCESIEKLLNQNKQLQQELTDYQKELAKADSMLQSKIFYGEELSSRQLLNMLKDYKERNEKAIEQLKKGLLQLDTRKREEVYIEQYIEEAIETLDKKDKEK